MTAQTTQKFTDLLLAPGRSPEIPEAADAYGWLVGDWELQCLRYRGEPVSIRGEAHFAWVLEGRAVQDVWIMPAGAERTTASDQINNMYGTTLRVWDSSIQAWRIYWRNPVRNHYEDQIGRWSGNEVVQIGVRPNGAPTRWRFTSITPDSFHWLGEALLPNGKEWFLEGEFQAKRIR
jgi:hypothetical protein